MTIAVIAAWTAWSAPSAALAKKKEVEKLRDEDPIAEVNCQFCGKQYKVDLNDLLKNWPDTVEKQ